MNDSTADALVTNLWTIFPPLFKLIRRRWNRGAKDGFSIYHYEVLGILSDHKEISMSEIGRFLGISKPNITPIIDSLVSAGVVQRYPDKFDRRVVRVALTSQGEMFMRDGKERAKEDMKELFARFDDKDINALVENFEKINFLLSQLETKAE
jgi:DNA-binding MarR family transcriptional regulator